MSKLITPSPEQKELPLDAIHRILYELVKRLEDTRWGSAAFDIEIGNTRNELYKLVKEERTSQIREEQNLLGELTGFLWGLSYELDDRRRDIALNYVRKLEQITKPVLVLSDQKES